MGNATVRIFDTTLRDGLRSSGIAMGDADRVRFGCELERLGVDVIEIGFGGPHEVDRMREIASAVRGPVVCGISRVNRKDVERVLRGVEGAKRPGVNVFHPTSDAFLAKSGSSREQGVERSVEAVRFARRHVDHVQFSAQDASRSDPEFLAEIVSAVVSAGATVVSIADTVSKAEPEEFAVLCRELRARTAAGEAVVWSVHCHNQRGLAVANSIAAIEEGIGQVECTVGGVGEGAGNTSLEGLLGVLDAGGPARTRIINERLAEIGALLRRISASESA